MRIFLTILVCGLGLVLAAPAWGIDLIVSRSVLEDRAGALSIDKVVHADFQPAGPVLSRGYTDSVYWLRIAVKPGDNADGAVLRIHPTFLDEITLYEPNSAHGWKTHVTGDRTPFVERELALVGLGFPIKPSAPETVYYLRLKTTSASLLLVEAVDHNQAWYTEWKLDVVQALYTGLMLWMLFWAITDYASSRQPVVGWFIIHQLCFVFYHIALMGYLGPMFPAAPHGWLDKLTSILVCLMLLLNLIFNRVVLGLFSPPRRAMLGLTALILLIPIELAAMASGYVRLSLQINALLALFSMPLFLVLSFFTQREAVPGRHILRIIFSVQTVFMLISLAPFLLGLETTEWRMQAMRMAFGFVYSILMFLLLYLRSQQLKREGAQAVMKLELTKRQLQTEQRQRDEQNRFMSMLNHELKTPLSVIRMALSLENMTAPVKCHAQQATNDIGAVIERCLQADQLEQRKLLPKRQATRLDVMLSELQATAPHRILLQCSELPVIATDPQLLRIALNNLTDNALKYAKAQSIVQMDAAISEQHGRQGILVGIANIPGAAGMPDPACAFNKYYRSPDAHGQTGSGLGLYLVCNIITLLAGWVRYCPSENDVRFELWLPL